MSGGVEGTRGAIPRVPIRSNIVTLLTRFVREICMTGAGLDRIAELLHEKLKEILRRQPD